MDPGTHRGAPRDRSPAAAPGITRRPGDGSSRSKPRPRFGELFRGEWTRLPKFRHGSRSDRDRRGGTILNLNPGSSRDRRSRRLRPAREPYDHPTAPSRRRGGRHGRSSVADQFEAKSARSSSARRRWWRRCSSRSSAAAMRSSRCSRPREDAPREHALQDAGARLLANPVHPDLMPSDMTGTEVIEEDKTSGRRELRFVSSPIFANVILADEINRTPGRGRLLERAGRQVTVGGESHRLPGLSSCSPPRTRSSRRGRIRFPKPSSTASCSTSGSDTRRSRTNSRSSSERPPSPTPPSRRSSVSGLPSDPAARRHIPVADHVARRPSSRAGDAGAGESGRQAPDDPRLPLVGQPASRQFLVLAAKAQPCSRAPRTSRRSSSATSRCR